MQITCPDCAAVYDVLPEAVGHAGRTARCARCHRTWLAQPIDTRPPLDLAAHLAPIDPDRTLAPSPVVDCDPDPDSPPRETPERLAMRAPRLRLRPFVPGLTALIAALLLIDGALIAARERVVRHAPQMASFYAALGIPVNLRGLALQGVTGAMAAPGSAPGLLVEGRIANVASRAASLPHLRFSIRDGAGIDIYTWIEPPPRAKLPAGADIAFTSRLDTPPPGGREVTVRFTDERPTLAGLR